MKQSRTFFSQSRAQEFAGHIEGSQIWTDRDGFGQSIYIVVWYI